MLGQATPPGHYLWNNQNTLLFSKKGQLTQIEAEGEHDGFLVVI